MPKFKHAAALAAATLTLAAGTTGLVGSATAAQASTCGTWINIGSPADLTVGGVKAGQLEQQFYGYCGGGGLVQVHFQWSAGFRSSNPGSSVELLMIDSDGNWLWQSSAQRGTGSPDVYSVPIDVHTSTRDEYQAAAFSEDNCPNNQEKIAVGSLHWYYNGADFGGASGGWCW